MKFSIVVPVVPRHSRYLKRCLMSVFDQDYENWEVCVVTDGNIAEAHQVVEDFASQGKNIKWQVTGEDPSGAWCARNLGAINTDGEILFFLDADCSLLPGVLRLCSDTLRDNPGFSWVYGGYRFNVDTLNVYHSRPWDSYLLESMNYISTMSPIRRDAFNQVNGFREKLDYFQDWDLWLRLSEKGHKGKYIEDILFVTEKESEDSISSSGPTFDKKVAEIEHLNHIPERPYCVTTIAAPYQAIERAKALNARYIGSHQNSQLFQVPGMFSLPYKAIYLQGFFPQAADSHARMFSGIPEDCVRAIQWIGTDVFQLRTSLSWENIKFLKENILSKIDLQYCNSPGLQEELREIGIDVPVLYQPLTLTPKRTELPKDFTVGVYYTDTNPMHNLELLMDVAHAMPDVKWIFFGGSRREERQHISFLPFQNIQDIIDRCSMNLRFTVHDGWPHTPIHFMLAGRKAVLNTNMPYAEFIDQKLSSSNYAEVKSKIIEKVRESRKTEMEGVDECVKHYQELMNPVQYRIRLEGEFREKNESKRAEALVRTSSS